jgi:hypothetical protein
MRVSGSIGVFDRYVLDICRVGAVQALAFLKAAGRSTARPVVMGVPSKTLT